MPKLSIIILSYNTREVTRQCLTELFKTLQSETDLEYEVIVIDNASTDGSKEMLEKFQNQNLKLIVNRKNVGFPKGNNQGLRMAHGEYILFLNSDVLIEKIRFKRLLAYLDSRLDVAVCTVRVNLIHDGIDPASHRGFPTIWNSFCYFFKLEKLFGTGVLGRLFGGYHLSYLDLQTIHEIDSPSGAFYLVRKKILEELKGFDEHFFMYGEDLDLSYRIKELGYKILYYPLFHVTHLKYVSGMKSANNALREESRKHFYEAMRIFYKKHYTKHHSSFVNNLVYWVIGLKEKL